MAVAVLVVIHIARTFVGGCGFVEFGSAASAFGALRDLAQYLTICALLDELSLVACL